jgi:murein L,D-transpeptidase YafK
MEERGVASRIKRTVGTVGIVTALGVALAPVAAIGQAVKPANSGRVLGVPKPSSPDDFSYRQLNHSRVLDARLEKRFALKKLFAERGVQYPAAETFLRIFKRERILEVWVRPGGDDRFRLLKTYPVCALTGRLGPKRQQGDLQTPEGAYYIDGLNPSSDFHLSLHIDYPNKSDRLLSSSRALGGDIFIHGGCSTRGCLAVTDDAIKELYWLAVEARTVGQRRIPVHIFPTQLTNYELNQLTRFFQKETDLTQFWTNLRPVYQFFETNRKLPLVQIDDQGRYHVQPQLGRPAGLAFLDDARPAHAATITVSDTAQKGKLVLPVLSDSVMPVLFAPKKGGSRRRALNRASVPE